MLLDIHIQNFAILDSIQLRFQEGESVITGETGSGKSLFVDAISFLSGGKVDRNVIRFPDQPCLVEASFYLEDYPDALKEILKDQGIEIEDDHLLVISREMDVKTTKTRINSRIVAQSLLKEIAPFLIDIHSQNAQSILANQANYIVFLDLFIGSEIQEEKKGLRKELDQVKALKKKKEDFNLSPEELARQIDLLEYQIKEIEDASLEEIDEDALNQEYKELTSSKDRMEAVQSILLALQGDYSIRQGMENIAKELEHLSKIDANLAELKDFSWQIQAEIESLEDSLDQYGNRIIINPQRIEEIDEIFLSVQKLKRKYGDTLEEILAYKEQCQEELTELDHIEENRKSLKKEMEELRSKIFDRVGRITELRKKGARALENRIKNELEEMAIKKLSFSISIKEADKISIMGKDEVDFLISTNIGEPMRSVSEVASGGEMSRFMLAFKIVMAEIEGIPTLIFDEIDTGISGRTAQVVGEKIQRLGRKHQVLVVTHLPQIAAMADHHYLVKKVIHDELTFSQISILNKEERIDEQARLIGGTNITNLTKDNAEEMLMQAENLREVGRDEK